MIFEFHNNGKSNNVKFNDKQSQPVKNLLQLSTSPVNIDKYRLQIAYGYHTVKL